MDGWPQARVRKVNGNLQPCCGNRFTLMGISFQGSSIEEIGPWSLHGYIQGGDLSGDDLVIAMGLYGIETLEL